VLSGDVLCVLLARTVVHPLDLRRNAILRRRFDDQRGGRGVKDAHGVFVVTANTHNVLVVIRKRQRAHAAAEEVVVDGVDGSFTLSGRNVRGP